MQTVTSRSIRFTTLLCAAALAACSPDRPTGVSTEPFEGGGAANLSPTSDCSVSTLSAYAKTYFGSGNNVASNDLKALSDACKAYVGAKGDTAKQSAAQRAADAAGFNVFRDIASVASARSAYSSAGASLTVGVLGYMDIGTAPADSIKKALMTDGMFAVASKAATAADQNTIFSRQNGDHWGIWADWQRDVLVYGWPIADISSYSQKGSYSINTLPTTTATYKPFLDQYSLGVCFRDANNEPTGKLVESNTRIQHTSQPDFLNESTKLCESQYLSSTASFGSRLLAMGRRAVGVFAPQNLYALGTTTKTGVGGFGSDLSPFYTPDMGGLVTTYTQQPSSGSTVSGGIIPDVKVLVTTFNGGIIVPRAIVILSVANNSGSPAGAYLSYTNVSGYTCPTGSACEVTDWNGIATFSGVKTNKPGGYTLAAAADFNGVLTITATLSNLFQVQQ